MHMSTATIQSNVVDDINRFSDDDDDDDDQQPLDQLPTTASSKYFDIDDTYSSDAFFRKPSPHLSPTAQATINQRSPLSPTGHPTPTVQILSLNDVTLGDPSTVSGPNTFSSTLNYPEDSPRQRGRNPAV